jgi:hypothetical protein
MSPNHVMLPPKELKNKKWYNTPLHHTNGCKVFKQHIQLAIDEGRLKFDNLKWPMKVDGNPFPMNMIEG